MATTMDRVVTTGLTGGNPFRNLKQEDVRQGGETRKVVNSKVVITAAGRVVLKPLPKN